MQQHEKKQIGTTDDLSKDMIFEGDEYKNNEGDSQSTASEGELKQPEAENGKNDTFKGNEEDAKDNNLGKTDEKTTDSDPTHIPSLEEDEKMEKSHG